jgi:hypothetical protein
MTAVKCPEEVYRKYLDRFGFDGDGDPDAIALFTFALVERDRFDWLEHHRSEHGGEEPTLEAVEQWYQSKPESFFDEKYRFALSWYTAFARNLLKAEIVQSNQDAVKSYFNEKLSFWSQIWSGLVGNVLFLIVLGLLSFSILSDFSAISWVKLHFFPRSSASLPVTPPPSQAQPK